MEALKSVAGLTLLYAQELMRTLWLRINRGIILTFSVDEIYLSVRSCGSWGMTDGIRSLLRRSRLIDVGYNME